jgi:CheY-like chemotaxis protein
VKFTRSEEARHITITVGASLERPTDSSSGFAYPGQDPSSTDPTADPQWGTGECLFLEFTVQDTGKSLSESEKSMLFKHGSTANPKTHVEYGGSGLGLFISRELIEMQGGEIGVASEPEGGTTFGFYIKTRRAPGSNTTAVALPEILRARSGSISTLRSLSSAVTAADIQFQEKPRVALVVEDNLINQKILARGLRKDGWTVAVANHGQEALDYIKASKHWRGNEANGGEYCVVLMDVEMPVMDGITWYRYHPSLLRKPSDRASLKTIRALEAEGSIGVRVPIIAVTANARSEQVTEAMEAGMVGRT